MIRKEIEIINKTGLHARPASLFVKEANKYKSLITVCYKDKELNGKSVISVLSGGISKGAKLVLVIDGEDEVEAASKLTSLLESLNE